MLGLERQFRGLVNVRNFTNFGDLERNFRKPHLLRKAPRVIIIKLDRPDLDPIPAPRGRDRRALRALCASKVDSAGNVDAAPDHVPLVARAPELHGWPPCDEKGLKSTLDFRPRFSSQPLKARKVNFGLSTQIADAGAN